MTLRELYRRVSSVDLEQLKKRAVEDNDRELVEINRQKQLFEKGLNAEGVEIWSYRPYKPVTQMIKAEKGQPTDRVTLKDTGSFHKAMFLAVKGDSYEMSSKDSKTQDLVQKYGDVFGIAPQFLNRAKSLTTRSMGRFFKKAIGGS